MQNVTSSRPDGQSPPEPQRFPELEAQGAASLRWIWQGYLAAGNVTLLTSQWKTGKTTLLSVLLTKMAAGGALAGLEVAPGRIALITEESSSHWRLRGKRLGFGNHIAFFCRPFPRKPDRAQWERLIDRLVRLHGEEGLDLIVFDTLATFLPAGTENQVDALLDVLRPLERLTDLGAAVLLSHHPRKGMPIAGQAARGSGALSGFADIFVEMHGRSAAGSVDRRRRLTGWSRYDETPRDLMIELSADGRDYVRSSEPFDEAVDKDLAIIVDVLKQSGSRLSRHGIREKWPTDKRPPSTTLGRLIDRGVARGVITVQDEGNRYHPFTYGLPGEEKPVDLCFADVMEAEKMVAAEEAGLPADYAQQQEKAMYDLLTTELEQTFSRNATSKPSDKSGPREQKSEKGSPCKDRRQEAPTKTDNPITATPDKPKSTGRTTERVRLEEFPRAT